MRPNLEAIVPGLRECRHAEHTHRALAFAGVTWTLCGCEVVHLTPRHRLELQMAGNAFAVQMPPLAGDVDEFLWRLNPAFTRRIRSPFAWMARRRVAAKVKKWGAEKSAREVKLYLNAMLQDMPETQIGTENFRTNFTHYIHWCASEAAFFLSRFHGFTSDTYMDTPYLVLQQLMRAWRADREDDASFINESDLIATRWQRQQMRGAQPATGGAN